MSKLYLSSILFLYWCIMPVVVTYWKLIKIFIHCEIIEQGTRSTARKKKKYSKYGDFIKQKSVASYAFTFSYLTQGMGTSTQHTHYSEVVIYFFICKLSYSLTVKVQQKKKIWMNFTTCMASSTSCICCMHGFTLLKTPWKKKRKWKRVDQYTKKQKPFGPGVHNSPWWSLGLLFHGCC